MTERENLELQKTILHAEACVITREIDGYMVQKTRLDKIIESARLIYKQKIDKAQELAEKIDEIIYNEQRSEL